MDMDIDIDLDVGIYENLIAEDFDIITYDIDSVQPNLTVQPEDPPLQLNDDLTPEKLLIEGLDDISSSELIRFASEHYRDGPKPTIEWVNDSSAKLVYPSAEIAAQALAQFVDHDVIARFNYPDIYPAKRLSTTSTAELRVRIATIHDQKVSNAREQSRYYLLHPDQDPDSRRKSRKSRGRRRDDDLSSEDGEVLEEEFDASMYDDDSAAIAKREADQSSSNARPRRSSRNRSRRMRSRSRSRSNAGRATSLSPTRKEASVVLYRRSRSPIPRPRSHRSPPRGPANRSKELFPAAAASTNQKLSRSTLYADSVQTYLNSQQSQNRHTSTTPSSSSPPGSTSVGAKRTLPPKNSHRELFAESYGFRTYDPEIERLNSSFTRKLSARLDGATTEGPSSSTDTEPETQSHGAQRVGRGRGRGRGRDIAARIGNGTTTSTTASTGLKIRGAAAEEREFKIRGLGSGSSSAAISPDDVMGMRILGAAATARALPGLRARNGGGAAAAAAAVGNNAGRELFGGANSGKELFGRVAGSGSGRRELFDGGDGDGNGRVGALGGGRRRAGDLFA